jgi:hypothetical protein
MSTDCIRRQHAYWTTCRCETCAPERAMRRKMHYVGYEWRVPHGVAWERLARCFAAGWSSSAVSSACGYDRDHFGRHLAAWRRGEETLLGPAVAADIMQMGRPTKGQVGAEPSRRRLRALAAIGYGLKTIADETGVGFSTLAMVRARNDRVNTWISNAIADAYDRISMRPGPDPQAAQLARAKGWASPLAWDDIDHDPEPATGEEGDVDPVVVHRILAGDVVPSTRAERIEVTRRWVADGRPLRELAAAQGWKTERYLRLKDEVA